jgi:hypothetical protein
MGGAHRSGEIARPARLPPIRRPQHDPARAFLRKPRVKFRATKTDSVFNRYNIVSEADIQDAARKIEAGAAKAVIQSFHSSIKSGQRGNWRRSEEVLTIKELAHRAGVAELADAQDLGFYASSLLKPAHRYSSFHTLCRLALLQKFRHCSSVITLPHRLVTDKLLDLWTGDNNSW